MAEDGPLVGPPKDMNRPLFGEDSNRVSHCNVIDEYGRNLSSSVTSSSQTKFVYIAVALITAGMVVVSNEQRLGVVYCRIVA